MFLIILFSISLLVLLVLLIGKAIEIKRGNKNWVTAGIAKLDPKAGSLIFAVSFRIRQAIQVVKYIVLVLIPNKAESSLRQAKSTAIKEYKKQKEIVMGKKDLSSNGGASFFLKKMKEGMEAEKGGTIEDQDLSENKLPD